MDIHDDEISRLNRELAEITQVEQRLKQIKAEDLRRKLNKKKQIVSKLQGKLVSLMGCSLHSGINTYKIVFVLNSAEHELFPANKYENANNSWHFHTYYQRNFHAQLCLARKNLQLLVISAGQISCSAELSIKQKYNVEACSYRQLLLAILFRELDTLVDFPPFSYREDNFCDSLFNVFAHRVPSEEEFIVKQRTLLGEHIPSF